MKKPKLKSTELEDIIKTELAVYGGSLSPETIKAIQDYCCQRVKEIEIQVRIDELARITGFSESGGVRSIGDGKIGSGKTMNIRDRQDQLRQRAKELNG